MVGLLVVGDETVVVTVDRSFAGGGLMSSSG